MKATLAVIAAVYEEICRRLDAGETWDYVYEKPVIRDRAKEEAEQSQLMIWKYSGVVILSISKREHEVWRFDPPNSPHGRFVTEPLDPIVITRDEESTTTEAEIWAALEGLPA